VPWKTALKAIPEFSTSPSKQNGINKTEVYDEDKASYEDAPSSTTAVPEHTTDAGLGVTVREVLAGVSTAQYSLSTVSTVVGILLDTTVPSPILDSRHDRHHDPRRIQALQRTTPNPHHRL